MASSDSKVVPGLPFGFKKRPNQPYFGLVFLLGSFSKKSIFSTILAKFQQNIQHYMKFQNLFDIFWQIISESF